MGTDDVTLICTHNKISIWFGRKSTKELIERILRGISNVDSCIEDEFEVICEYEAIKDYENRGLTLVSYARCIGQSKKYRAIFNIPFLNRESLRCLTDLIFDKLRKSNITRNLIWEGNDTKIMLLREQFSDIDGWGVEQIR